MSQLFKYEYYDTPEGQDIFMKTFALSKYAALAGTALASMDVLMFSHPKGFVGTAGRFAWFLGPMVGMAAGFTVTANTAQNIRGKNDKLNYFLGGAVSGSILSAWLRSGIIAVPAAVILGAAAVVKKTAIDEGWSFFPPVPHATQSARSVKYDWTMVKDIEELKNFTTGSN
ncbi:NADH dehydrogenase [ubiquinone] 1 alpha subcomplex subunit 11 [Spodoptera frugiperda]|uniref:NADH dehydrogenase [ubiquinone] 1 alpha subcomplex subunit 11 n=1 Tax=Spodoptera frugiperda TaxID=7108 RepID=A0A2H1WS21_SPOFR|nr:NADH dehydrogenase [ubiquinone] 1 alpha subcomplex subunit 11 [Spodoptera frugiperda]